jgi:hypothetical protein
MYFKWMGPRSSGAGKPCGNLLAACWNESPPQPE